MGFCNLLKLSISFFTNASNLIWFNLDEKYKIFKNALQTCLQFAFLPVNCTPEPWILESCVDHNSQNLFQKFKLLICPSEQSLIYFIKSLFILLKDFSY